MKNLIILTLMVFAVVFIVGNNKGIARPQQSSQEMYTVIKMDNGRVYINAGSEEGAAVGMQVTLFESIKSHDKKGTPIEDLIPIGNAALRYVGNHSSFFIVDSAAFKLLHLGSPVGLSVPVGKKEITGEAQVISKIQQSAVEKSDTLLKFNQFSYSVSEFKPGEPIYFQIQVPPTMYKVELRVRKLGEDSYTTVPLNPSADKSVLIGKVDKEFHQDARIDYYIRELKKFGEEKYLVGTPENPRVSNPLTVTPSAAQAQKKVFDPKLLGFLHNVPAGATIFETVPITIYAPEPMRTPKLYYRVRGNVDYKEIEMTPKPNDYYFYEIPKEEVSEPAVEYYLTVSKPTGEEVLALGNPEYPIAVPVIGILVNPVIELQRHRGNRNMIRVLAERVVFKENDKYQHFEIDYMYRIFTTLYSIRMGMGVFRGEGFMGGNLQSQRMDYYYGYTEAEVKIPRTATSVIGRFFTGINNSGIGSGFESKVRFGDELGVNLVVSVWTASRLGTSTAVQLNVPLNPRFGFSGNIAVEDLPVAGQTGFRMAVDVKYEVVTDLDVIARVGMGARTTEFIGTNFGLGFVRHF